VPLFPALVDDVVGRYLRTLEELAPGVVDAVYLTGSVAMGDFRTHASDVDFVAVTRESIYPKYRELWRTHARLRRERRRPFFDGVYVTWDDLRRDPAAVVPGAVVHEGRWKNDVSGAANPVTWHELAWYGVRVLGPERDALAVWTDSATLVRWTRRNMADYWRPWHARARRPLSVLGVAGLGSWAPAWGVLGVARQRYTIATGQLTSKHGAGEWAREVFAPRWHPIIDECLRIRTGAGGPSSYASPFDRRRDALDFMGDAMAEVLGPSS
jgi:predicted nucleotidyltransferase